MNQLEFLAESLKTRFPELQVTFDPPLLKDGFYFADARNSEAHVVVQWREGGGFGISKIRDDTGYGEGADHYIENPNDALEKIIDLLGV